MSATTDERWTVDPEAVTAELDGEIVIWHPKQGVARLDRLGALVWESLDGATTLDQLVDELSADFGAARDVVDADVRALLHRLGDLGLAQRG